MKNKEEKEKSFVFFWLYFVLTFFYSHCKWGGGGLLETEETRQKNRARDGGGYVCGWGTKPNKQHALSPVTVLVKLFAFLNQERNKKKKESDKLESRRKKRCKGTNRTRKNCEPRNYECNTSSSQFGTNPRHTLPPPTTIHKLRINVLVTAKAALCGRYCR